MNNEIFNELRQDVKSLLSDVAIIKEKIATRDKGTQWLFYVIIPTAISLVIGAISKAG